MTTGRINQVTVVWPRDEPTHPPREGGPATRRRTARLAVERRTSPRFKTIRQRTESLQILKTCATSGQLRLGEFKGAQRRCRELSTSQRGSRRARQKTMTTFTARETVQPLSSRRPPTQTTPLSLSHPPDTQRRNRVRQFKDKPSVRPNAEERKKKKNLGQRGG